MNAPPPQASYPCGNFSGISRGDTKYTSPRKVRWAVLSHVIVAYVSTRVRSKGNISPYGLSEVSVLTELPVGHLCCGLTDVPPQSNSPSVGVRIESQPSQASESIVRYVRQPNRQVAVFHGRFRVSNRVRNVPTSRRTLPGLDGPESHTKLRTKQLIATVRDIVRAPQHPRELLTTANNYRTGVNDTDTLDTVKYLPLTIFTRPTSCQSQIRVKLKRVFLPRC